MQERNNNIRNIELENKILIPEVIKLINEGYNAILTPKGFSMRPFLEHLRDKVLLTKPQNIRKGDAVLAEIQKDKWVFHRIIKIDGDNVTLRGDGNLFEEHCKVSDIQASAVGFYRKGSEKLCKVTSMKWKFYSLIWTNIYPIRRYLLFIYRQIIKLQYKLNNK